MKLALVLLCVRAATGGRTNMLVLTPILRRWTVSGLVKRLVEGKRWSASLHVTLTLVPALLSTCSSSFIRNLQVKRSSVVKTFYIEAFFKSIYCVTM